jgi:acyl transferase domain-containing protein
MVQFAMAKQVEDLGLHPDLLLGVSLGEFAAMSVAGMIPFETALRAIANQPRVFDGAVPAGTLIVALAPDDRIAANPGLDSMAEIVDVNGARHCALACAETLRQDIITALNQAAIAHQSLPVPYAFHSRWIDGAQAAFLVSVADLRLETPFCPVWPSRLAAPVYRADATHLWQIVHGAMRLHDTVAAIEVLGGAHFVDFSPASTIAAILGQDATDSPSRRSAILSQFGNDDTRLRALIAGT